jgi:hypothetical protein
MRQLFIIAPNGIDAIHQAMSPRQTTIGFHHWTADGDSQAIGVIELYRDADAESVIDKLEAKGIMWMPNHLNNEQIKPEHAVALSKYGVLPSHTTAEAMEIIHGKSGFRPLKPLRKRF